MSQQCYLSMNEHICKDRHTLNSWIGLALPTFILLIPSGVSRRKKRSNRRQRKKKKEENLESNAVPNFGSQPFPNKKRLVTILNKTTSENMLLFHFCHESSSPWQFYNFITVAKNREKKSEKRLGPKAVRRGGCTKPILKHHPFHSLPSVGSWKMFILVSFWILSVIFRSIEETTDRYIGESLVKRHLEFSCTIKCDNAAVLRL